MLTVLRRTRSAVIVVIAVLLELVNWPSIGSVRGTNVVVPPAAIAVAIAAAYSLLFLRWRRPMTIFLLMWGFSLVGFVLTDLTLFVGLLVALHALASRMPLRSSVTALSLCAVPLAVDAANAMAVRFHQSVSPLVSFSALFGLYATVAAGVWAAGRFSYRAEIRAEERQRLLAAAAVRLERTRLARELHDIVSHAVSAMLLQAAGARTFAGDADERVRQSLSLIESQGVQAMNELHRLLGLLRSADDEPSGSTELPPSAAEIVGLVDAARRSGLDVELVEVGRAMALDPSVELAAYRVVQEGLTNAMKYGGAGAEIGVRLEWTDQGVRVQVRDHAGAVPARSGASVYPSGGQGLRGLRERVASVGGRFDAHPVASGFLLAAQLPGTAEMVAELAAESAVESGGPAAVAQVRDRSW